jgi:dihydroxyacetone kinase
MAGNLSNYLETRVLDHILGTTAFTMPTAYLALYTVAPTDSTAGTEVTGGSYARKTIAFDAAASGAATNSANVDFTGMPTATVVAVAVVDDLTSGNILVYGPLTTSRAVVAGDTLRISAGDLSISID